MLIRHIASSKKCSLRTLKSAEYRSVEHQLVSISNLLVLSKLLGCLVVCDHTNYLANNNLLPPAQSGFLPGHSADIAVLRVSSDIVAGDLAAPAQLDPPTAVFDPVEHEILFQRLPTCYCIELTIPWWSGFVLNLMAGLPVCQLLVLYLVYPKDRCWDLYTADLAALINGLSLSPHLHTDDTYIDFTVPVCRQRSMTFGRRWRQPNAVKPTSIQPRQDQVHVVHS